MREEKILLNDGEQDVEMGLVATFLLDETNYCCLRDPEDGTELLYRMRPEGEEMVIEAIEDEKELEEAEEAYQELLDEKGWDFEKKSKE